MEKLTIPSGFLRAPTLTLDIKYNIINWTKDAEAFFNTDLSSLTDRCFFDLCKQRSIQPPSKSTFQTLNDNTYIDYPEKNNKFVWRIALLSEQNKDKASYIVSIIDLDSYNQQRSVTYLDNIVKNFPGYLYWKDKHSIYQGCNLKFAKAAGVESPQHIIGKTDYDLAWGDTEAELFRKGDQEALAGKAKYDFEEPQRQANGKIATVLASKAPLLDKQGHIIGVIGTYQDITKQKTIEKAAIDAKEEALQQKQKAELANEAKTNFLATISHELRTPLNGILGMAEMLSQNDISLDKIHETAHDIYQSGSNLLSIVNDILDFTKLEAGKIELTKKPFNLKQLTEGVMRTISNQVDDDAVKLSTQYSKQLPDLLLGDELRIRQILVNLIGNAVKFTEKGSITVKVECAKVNNNLINTKLIISDTGIGIPKNKLEKIFDRFTQVESSYNRKHQGTGLGLAICKQLVELMKGKIEAKSNRSGSTFFVSIPFELANTLKQNNKLCDEKTNANLTKNLGLKVLVVEDHPINQKVTVFMLNGLGCTADVADHGKEAIKLAKSHQYDLILMDISLPDMDGMEITHHIRKLSVYYQQLPIIAVTAHAFEESQQEFLEAGLNDVITKPINQQNLQTMIHKWVNKKEQN